MEPPRPCPDAALLAAFIDGTLADFERTAVVSHLIECQECRAVALTVVEFREVQALKDAWRAAPMPAPPPPLIETGVIRWTREKTRAPALAVAALAAVTAIVVPLYFVLPSRSAQQAVAQLINLAEEQRPFEARLSGMLDYAPAAPRVAFSPSTPAAAIQFVSTASHVRDAHSDDYDAPSRRAVGVAAILAGDLDDAIGSLTMAAAADPSSAAAANDLAVALYERARLADRPDDLPAALNAAEHAITIDPAFKEAWFNRALIISALELRAEARDAWQQYLNVDARSPWAEEARVRLDALRTSDNAAEWAAIQDRLLGAPDAATASAAVADHAARTKSLLHGELLTRAVQAATAQQALLTYRLLGEAFERLTGDRFYVDIAAALERAPGDEVQAAVGDFQAGLKLMPGRASDAAPSLKKAERQLTRLIPPLALRTRIELAGVEYYAGRYDRAAELVAPLAATAQAARYALPYTHAVWLEGLAEYGRNNFGAAQRAYEDMLRSSRALGDADLQVMADLLLGNLHWVLGRQQDAWRHRVAAASRIRQVSSPNVAALAYGSAAADAAAAGYFGAALLFESVPLHAHSGIAANTEAQVRAQRVRTLLALGRNGDAHRELERAYGAVSRIADPEGRARVEVDVLMAEAALTLRDHPARAMAAAERALALPLIERDQLRRARLNAQLVDAAAALGDFELAEEAVRRGLEALETLQRLPTADFAIGSSDPAWALYTQAAELAIRRGDLPLAFQYGERSRIRTAQERHVWGQGNASLSEVQQRLDPTTAVVLVDQSGTQLRVWIVGHQDVRTYLAPVDPAKAAWLVATHLDEIARETSAPSRSGELFDTLFGPGREMLAGVRQLVVVADAPYDRVAYAGLWDRRRDRFLVENHSVVLAPSVAGYAWALERSPAARPPASPRAVIVEAVADASSRADRRVAAAVSSAYGDVRVRRDQAASPSELLAEVARADVIHIAAPAIASGEYPALSALRLEDEPGKKHSGAIYTSRLAVADNVRARVVSLQDAAVNPISPRAEGTLSVARGLIAAGVPSVVSPIVAVSASGLEKTWSEFHRRLATGAAPADSLRHAQLAALSASNHRSGPWAALTAFGSTQ